MRVLLRRICSGSETVVWSAQIEGVFASDPDPEEQAEVRSHLPRGHRDSDAASRARRRQGQDRQDLPSWLHGYAQSFQLSSSFLFG